MPPNTRMVSLRPQRGSRKTPRAIPRTPSTWKQISSPTTQPPHTKTKKGTRHHVQSQKSPHQVEQLAKSEVSLNSSPGADTETLARWKRNRRAVERLQQQSASRMNHWEE